MKEYQKELDDFYQKSGWEYWPPFEILAHLMEETGEFARIVSHDHGAKKKKLDEKDQHIEEEMGDIIYALICYANSHGLDLDRGIRQSFNKAMTRDKNRFKKKEK